MNPAADSTILAHMTEKLAFDIQPILSAIDSALEKVAQPIAAFDADGTLWNTDLGEALFDYQVRNNLLKNLPADPWKHYVEMKEKVSHEAAYLWLAQINKGLPLKQINQWAQKAVDELHPVPVFAETKAIVSHLLERKVKVYIVTASIKWAVEPGAPLLGLKPQDVLGIQTAVEDGIITDQKFGPLTYRRGKVDGLLSATGGVAPFFCAGNTEGDLPLLESATHLRYVVAANPVDNHNFGTERHMLEIAKKRGWFYHDYL